MHAVVIGETDVARLACATMSDRGDAVDHLLEPTEDEVRSALVGDVEAVAVLLRGDVAALRYSLLVEHLRPGVRLVSTIFDRTLAVQLIRVVPNCQVTSPADVSIPSIIGACLGDGVLAVADSDQGLVVFEDSGRGVEVGPYRRHRRSLRSLVGAAAGQFRPHDDATRILLLGLAGLLTVLLLTWALSVLVLHESLVRALYLSTRVVATVGPDNVDRSTASWYLLFSAGSMLLTIAFTAVFTAGVVNRLLSARSVGIIGPRTVPTRDHVVVVGLGQVGLRLAVQLKRAGIGVVVIERDPRASNLRLARAAGVPVLIAHADDRSVLRRLGLPRARALAAMGSDELDNIEVAINALADAPDLRVVLRAGEDDVIAETRSLFRIGQVCDVSALTALAVTLSLRGQGPGTVYAREHDVAVFDGETESTFGIHRRCLCGGPTG